jgi:hypothetical protein
MVATSIGDFGVAAATGAVAASPIANMAAIVVAAIVLVIDFFNLIADLLRILTRSNQWSCGQVSACPEAFVVPDGEGRMSRDSRGRGRGAFAIRKTLYAGRIMAFFSLACGRTVRS